MRLTDLKKITLLCIKNGNTGGMQSHMNRTREIFEDKIFPYTLHTQYFGYSYAGCSTALNKWMKRCWQGFNIINALIALDKEPLKGFSQLHTYCASKCKDCVYTSIIILFWVISQQILDGFSLSLACFKAEIMPNPTWSSVISPRGSTA